MRAYGAALIRLATVIGVLVSALGARAALAQPRPARVLRELRRFAAAEARQGVAVDARHVYAISDRAIGKYDKRSAEKVAEWRDRTGTIVHLNGGMVHDGRLYCAHSNYPGVPMVSSIEVFDTGTLQHVDSHRFGVLEGSATWIDRRDDGWLVAFANYDGKGGVAGKGTSATALIAFDAQWQPVARYTLPAELVPRLRPYSSSGGVWGPDGLLYVTGHDAAEVYALRLPAAGGVLELVDVIAAPIAGQGIAWDPSEPGILYGIIKARQEIVVSRLVTNETPSR